MRPPMARLGSSVGSLGCLAEPRGDLGVDVIRPFEFQVMQPVPIGGMRHLLESADRSCRPSAMVRTTSASGFFRCRPGSHRYAKPRYRPTRPGASSCGPRAIQCRPDTTGPFRRRRRRRSARREGLLDPWSDAATCSAACRRSRHHRRWLRCGRVDRCGSLRPWSVCPGPVQVRRISVARWVYASRVAVRRIASPIMNAPLVSSLSRVRVSAVISGSRSAAAM